MSARQNGVRIVERQEEAGSDSSQIWLSSIVSRACDKFFERRGISSGSDYSYYGSKLYPIAPPKQTPE